MSELVERQAAIEVIDAVFPVDPMKSEYAQGIACGAALAKTYVEQLPSVQPEPLTLIVNRELTKEEYDKLMQDIKDAPIVLLPSAQPEQQWIPCRNYLPSLRDEIYLVSLAWGGVGMMEFKDTGWHNYGSLSPVPIETVTAWMPLPEPWKEGEADGNQH